MPTASDDRTRVESIFVRHRNTLMVRANFCDIFTDHYLHLADQNLRYPPELDHKLKELYVALTLHATARPWSEVHAWTANLRAPRVNFFATASSTHENVVGRVFTDDVREPPQNLLYVQVNDGQGGEPRRSTVALDNENPFDWLTHYYSQSEQRPARLFELPDENFVLLAAQPAFDEEWFESLTTEKVAALAEEEELSPLENRFFRYHCGCTRERIMPALSVWQDKLDELFQGEDRITVQCPRCAAKHTITPADFASDQ
ncbi:Hsp33 family molecular chaperone HslO [Roseibacillus ishigakijimensis]|uniref:Hsp33 family molecular chaperone HslO n=1 Tax=Roseibacillus ishigakijimensis TaxID=454146 RepID=A0A934RS30_9BACT|nr:Hsp33 family molecular chaperone HslO [Roseibacillus ishigakijimensis]MBK1833481.1 Hsp33 family molecular chaperone HslO [Roseibacillus ishigakijimensis]